MLVQLSSPLLQDLLADLYDEVDRRDTDTGTLLQSLCLDAI